MGGPGPGPDFVPCVWVWPGWAYVSRVSPGLVSRVSPGLGMPHPGMSQEKLQP